MIEIKKECMRERERKIQIIHSFSVSSVIIYLYNKLFIRLFTQPEETERYYQYWLSYQQGTHSPALILIRRYRASNGQILYRCPDFVRKRSTDLKNARSPSDIYYKRLFDRFLAYRKQRNYHLLSYRLTIYDRQSVPVRTRAAAP